MFTHLMNLTIVAGVLGTSAIDGSDHASKSISAPSLFLAADPGGYEALSADTPLIGMPGRSDGIVGVFSDEPTPSDLLDEALAALHNELLQGEKDIAKLVDEIGELSSTTIEDAFRAAEQAIGIGTRIDRLLEEGGNIDERIRDARGFFRGTAQAIAENRNLSESQRGELLDAISGHQANLTIEINRLQEMRGVIQKLTQKARQSREYLAMAHLAMVGGEIVERIRELNDTLSSMAATLRQMTTDASVAAT